MSSGEQHPWLLWMGSLVLVLILSQAFPVPGQQPTTSPPVQVESQPNPSPLYGKPLFLSEGPEWRAYPLLVDINEDGHLDIVATHRTPVEYNSLHIWLGTGQGTFNEIPQTWPSPGYSGLAAGDINHDGHLDLIAGSHFNRLVTYLGDGKGQFTVSTLETPDGYVATRLVDVNGDGHLDAIALGTAQPGLEIYHGDGTGKWTLAAQLLPGHLGRNLAIGDINGDGKPDIVAVFEFGVAVFLQDETGGWVQSPMDGFAIPGQFWTVALGDVNQDGHLDIVLNGGFPGTGNPHGPDVYLGDGKGGWTPASQGLKVFGPSYQVGVAVGDVDNDGCLDIVAGGKITTAAPDATPSGGKTTAAFDATPYGLFLFTGDCRGNWTLQPNSGLPSQGLSPPQGIALGDLNHDGRLDIVGVHSGGQRTAGYISVWLHQ